MYVVDGGHCAGCARGQIAYGIESLPKTGEYRREEAGCLSIRHKVMRRLQRIAREQQRSVIVVSHDRRIGDSGDEMLWLEYGQFEEEGDQGTQLDSTVSILSG